jgi:hypothetical protein
MFLFPAEPPTQKSCAQTRNVLTERVIAVSYWGLWKGNLSVGGIMPRVRIEFLSARTISSCLLLVMLICILASPGILASDDMVVVEGPPLRDGGTHKAFTWGNDVTIVAGPVEGGISIASDTSGNLYAVRCSTDVSTTLIIYKSTDAGESWFYLTQTGAPSGSLLHPVLLTGSTEDKLYLFYLTSNQYGSIRLLRYTQDGTFDGNFGVKLDSDTITYFSACTDLGAGDHLMVVFERRQMGDYTPDLYSIMSIDQGETWSSEFMITGDGSHPDVAYGNDGYLYCVHEKTGGADTQIAFIRSSDYGISWEAGTGEYLTGDLYDDTYPTVAALHHPLPDDAYVWVAYNHDWGDGNIDLYYAYSSDGGVNWSYDHPLANSGDYDEMACDLWAKPEESYNFVRICYLRYGTVSIPPLGLAEISDIYSAIVYRTSPTGWYAFEKTSDHSAAMSEDGREVCQGAYTKNQVCALYAGKPSSVNFENLYFDNGGWVDVEEQTGEEELIPRFSLSNNYPNPFNPATRIRYTVHGRQTPFRTTLKIYNIRGQLVRTLVDEPEQAGTYEVTWDGRDEKGDEVSSGVYLYRLEAGDFSEAKKMVLMR